MNCSPLTYITMYVSRCPALTHTVLKIHNHVCSLQITPTTRQICWNLFAFPFIYWRVIITICYVPTLAHQNTGLLSIHAGGPPVLAQWPASCLPKEPWSGPKTFLTPAGGGLNYRFLQSAFKNVINPLWCKYLEIYFNEGRLSENEKPQYHMMLIRDIWAHCWYWSGVFD